MRGVPKRMNVDEADMDEADMDEVKVCEADFNEEEEAALNAFWEKRASDKSF